MEWSTDSRFILYSDKPQVAEPWALFAVELETRETHRLTSPPVGTFGDRAPSLAMEGNRLAFIRGFSTYNASEIRTLELGREMTPIRESSAVRIERPRPVRSARSVFWSRSGDGLLFLDSGALWRTPASGGEATRLLAPGGSLGSAVLSRDGRRVALVRSSLDIDIWRLNVSSGEATPLLTSTQVDWSHSISPDSARIAWTSWRSGYSEIWICDADGSNPLQLTFLETQSGSPMWSPDGRTLAFDTRVNGDGDIYLIDANGGVPHPLVHGPDDDLQPSWSSGSDLVYFTSRRGGDMAIWSIDVDSREIQRVSDARGFSPKVSPDGRFLYFRGDPSTERGRLYRRRLAEGTEEVLLENVVRFALTAQRVYFSSRETGAIHRLDLGSGQVELLFQPDRLAGEIAVFPDEQTILFTQSEPRQSDLMLVEGFR